jgi:hypothetical protein
MKILRTVVILALFLTVIAFSGCVGAAKTANTAAVSNTNPDNSNSAKTNEEELGLTVNIPYKLEDNVWKEDTAHKKLTAVLQFSAEDAVKIVTEATKMQPPQPTTLSPASWYPPELIAQSEMSGDDTIDGIAYAADAFFEVPYDSGRIVRIKGTDYFVLELSAR